MSKAFKLVNQSELEYLDLKLNLHNQMAIRNGVSLKLSKTEYALLRQLMMNKGIILSGDQLFLRVWQIMCPPDRRRLAVHICNLRKKLDKPFSRKLIHTVPHAGYILK